MYNSQKSKQDQKIDNLKLAKNIHKAAVFINTISTAGAAILVSYKISRDEIFTSFAVSIGGALSTSLLRAGLVEIKNINTKIHILNLKRQ